MLLYGYVNQPNCRYWAGENPHWMREYRTQRHQNTIVWAGIIGDPIVSPVFFNDNVTGQIT